MYFTTFMIAYIWEDLGVDGRIILDDSLGNRAGGCGLDTSGSG
jgi:hypothetical protein